MGAAGPQPAARGEMSAMATARITKGLAVTTLINSTSADMKTL